MVCGTAANLHLDGKNVLFYSKFNAEFKELGPSNSKQLEGSGLKTEKTTK